MAVALRQICPGLLFVLLLISGLCVSAVHGHSSPEQCSHGHDHHHGDADHGHASTHQCSHGHDHDHHHHHSGAEVNKRKLLPEELAEEEDLKLYGFGTRDEHHHHHHDHGHVDSEFSGLGLWLHAMSCSLLVSLASLVCLIILPLIFLKGRPSKAIVDALALFGAGAMLGDAFLHQLPHAFGDNHSHSESHAVHSHDHDHVGHSHSHSLKDLSVGLSILAGIVLFLIVEKLVRYVEELSGGVNAWGHGHHHHHHSHSKKLKDDNNPDNDLQGLTHEKTGSLPEKESGGSKIDGQSAEMLNGEKGSKNAVLRKRNSGGDDGKLETNGEALNSSKDSAKSTKEGPAKSQSSLVFGYLNLFSDGVHNFTDGMALGSAFLLYGSVGGWSRTLFLLAHELPQEIGDFGILVRSGFSVSKALFFNFLSALMALAGTALALVLGQDPGQSSLIEGFTAGGFIYVAVAGVLAESNSGSSLSVKSTVIQLISLSLGMAVALSISLVE